MAPVDKRRAELVVPYRHTPAKVNRPPAVFTSTMPMAAMFLRNKLIAWSGFFTALQSYLSEPAFVDKNSDQQASWISVVTAVVSLLTCYADFVMPKQVPPVRDTAEAVVSAVTGK